MPTYEYRCQNCGKGFETFLTYAEYDQQKVICPACESSDVERRISKIRIAKSEESRIEAMVDPAQLSGIEDDPKALGRLMRQMEGEMGEEVGPEFDEVVSRLEKGQHPDQIEREMPDLGEMASGDSDSDE
jgi:putative FmdB family regulatory protein